MSTTQNGLLSVVTFNPSVEPATYSVSAGMPEQGIGYDSLLSLNTLSGCNIVTWDVALLTRGDQLCLPPVSIRIVHNL